MPASKTKRRICERCGATYVKRPRPYKPKVCRDCGLTDAASAARQMHAKQGPVWDAWLASNAAGAAKRRLNESE